MLNKIKLRRAFMGTRGTCGFYKNGESKLVYNHMDSYPDGLGKNIVDFVNACSLEELNKICDSLILIDPNSKPTEEQVVECYKWYDDKVSSGSPYEWYCLLRKAQGNFGAYKQGLRYMIDGSDFIKNSLHCEYGYIINLDTDLLEVYVGFQKVPNNNRYACEPYRGYYNCKLINEFPLYDIPENWLTIVLNTLEKDKNEEEE